MGDQKANQPKNSKGATLHVAAAANLPPHCCPLASSWQHQRRDLFKTDRRALLRRGNKHWPHRAELQPTPKRYAMSWQRKLKVWREKDLGTHLEKVCFVGFKSRPGIKLWEARKNVTGQHLLIPQVRAQKYLHNQEHYAPWIVF